MIVRGIFPICCLSPGTPVLEMSLSENLGNFPGIQWLINVSQSQMLHVWNICQHLLHLPYTSPSHVGKYAIHGAYGNVNHI
jgi:hypothetical protein